MAFPIVRASDMQLGDTVAPVSRISAYDTQTVKQIKDGEITMFRPYVQTADFAYTGGVICYIGIEEYSISQYHEEEWYLLDRVTLK